MSLRHGLRGLWQPLLIASVITPLMTWRTAPEEGLSVSLVSAMVAILAYGAEHADSSPGSPRARGWFALLIGFLILVGWIDRITGYTVDVTVLYYVPIALGAWYLSLFGAACTVGAALAIWMSVHLAMRGAVPITVVTWNALEILVSFTLIAWFVARERQRQHPGSDAPVRASVGM